VGPYSTNIGSRIYLMSESGSEYQMFKLKNREFTLDVDVSNLPCGLNGAVYFVEMSPDGGMSAYPSNKAGAKYGTGYCDAQCPHDMKFINGEGNVKDWKPSPTDKNAGIGFYGTCCTEMDIWEANKFATAVTPHPCSVRGQTRCSGTECGDADQRYQGVCDKDGCDYNSWRMGNKTYFGPGSQFAIDTTKPVTVITQFLTSDNTDSGDLVAIRRKYKQNGKVFDQSVTNVPGLPMESDATDKFCDAQKQVFGDNNDFAKKGGLKALGNVLDRGVVLVMSLWDDHEVHMLWLDSNFPTTADPTKPGISRGPCSTDSGKPDDVESQYPNSQVKYSNIKVGTIGSTF
jgi:cellulose 1,4-beta-cellobiosidase